MHAQTEQHQDGKKMSGSTPHISTMRTQTPESAFFLYWFAMIRVTATKSLKDIGDYPETSCVTF